MDTAEIDRLLKRFQAHGDGQSLAILFEQVAPTLLRVAIAMRRDRGVAEDVVQETFVRVIESIDRWDSKRPAMPGMVGVLANVARSQGRANRPPDALRLAAMAPEPVAPTTLAADHELAGLVEAEMAALPPVQRSVLRLHLLEGLSLHEVAAKLQRPASTVRTQATRALAFLRGRIAPAASGAALFPWSAPEIHTLVHASLRRAGITLPMAAAVLLPVTSLTPLILMKKLVIPMVVAASLLLAASVWIDDLDPVPVSPGAPIAALFADSPEEPDASSSTLVTPSPVVDARDRTELPTEGLAPWRLQCSVRSASGPVGQGRAILARWAKPPVVLGEVELQADGTAVFALDAMRQVPEATLRQERLAVVVFAPGFTVGKWRERPFADAELTKALTVDVQMQLNAAPTVAARIVGEDKKPVGDAKVELTTGETLRSTTTFADGRLFLDCVGAQSYMLVVTGGNGAAVRCDFTSPAVGHVDLGTLVLARRGGGAMGRVLLADGTPAADVEVRIVDNGSAKDVRTDSEGWFRHPGVRSRQFSVELFPIWGPDGFHASVLNAKEEHGPFATDGAPPVITTKLRHVRIEFIDRDGKVAAPRMVYTRHGWFEGAALMLPGSWPVHTRAEPDGVAEGVLVVPDQVSVVQRLQLRATAPADVEVEVHATYDDGTLVDKVSALVLTHELGQFWTLDRGKSETGIWRARVSAGKFKIVVDDSRQGATFAGSEVLDLEAKVGEVLKANAVLKRHGRLAVTLDPGSAKVGPTIDLGHRGLEFALENSDIQVHSWAVSGFDFPWRRRVEGSFLLPAGTYTLVVKAPGFLDWRGRIEAKAGVMTECTVAMTPK